MAIKLAKKLFLVLTGWYSVLLPVYAVEDITFGQYILTLPFPWELIMLALPFVLLFLLLFALFMLPLNVLKERMNISEPKIPVILSVVLALIGTYYAQTNQLLWSFWLTLFTGGIFIAAMIILIGGLLVIIGLTARGGAYMARGMGRLAVRRGEWLQKAAGREATRAEFVQARARRLQVEEATGVSRAQQLVRSAAGMLRNAWSRLGQGRLSAVQLNEVVTTQIKELQAARNAVRNVVRELGIEEGSYLMSRTGERRSMADVRKEMASLRTRRLGAREIEALRQADATLANLINADKVIMANLNSADREIKRAEKLAGTLRQRGADVRMILTNAYNAMRRTDEILANTRVLLGNKTRNSTIALQALEIARQAEIREARALRVEERSSPM